MYLLIAGKEIFVSSVISIQSCISSRAASTFCRLGFFFGGSVVSFTTSSSISLTSRHNDVVHDIFICDCFCCSVETGRSPQTTNEGGGRLGGGHLLNHLHRCQGNLHGN